MNRPTLFAHGAGAGSSSPWMRAWADRLAAALGAPVRRFDYPYMAAGRKAPDRLPKLLVAHGEALDGLLAGGERGGAVLIGKSMGSRVGCHLAVERPADVAALVCLGYPLRAPKGSLRDEVLLALETPVLFVQGTRDPLCPLDALAAVRPRMRAPSALHVVETGNHSLEITRGHTKATGVTQEDADAAAVAAIVAFLAQHAPA
ncbi:MAG: alpha/beta fold hydrolase [Myxococcales bacterium]|nr:alpha/beta fold hydrolase [Myxococcales bacterium]